MVTTRSLRLIQALSVVLDLIRVSVALSVWSPALVLVCAMIELIRATPVLAARSAALTLVVRCKIIAQIVVCC